MLSLCPRRQRVTPEEERRQVEAAAVLRKLGRRILGGTLLITPSSSSLSAYRMPLGLEKWDTFDISDELVQDILAGDTVLFLGAGWDAPAKLPSWVDLLNMLIDRSAIDAQKKKPLKDLISGWPVPANNLDQCAQQLQDLLGIDTLSNMMKQALTPPNPLPDLMQRRINLIKDIPFVGILTTNYTSITPGKTPWDDACPYLQILRHQDCWEDPLYAGAKPKPIRPVIQCHGNFITEGSIVLTRQGYRSLMYSAPGYLTFLRSMMATKTVVYLGFSFTDAYINEIRSEVVAMLDDGNHKVGRPPIAYALVPDMPQISQEFYLRNEGVHITTWSPKTQGWGKFEDWLELLKKKVQAAKQTH